MNITKIIAVFLLLASACTSENDRFQNELDNHIQLKKDKINVVSTGNTICFVKEEINGIDRSRYPSPQLNVEFDHAFFYYLGSKSFSNPDEAGGFVKTVDIYKALQTGQTTIRTYEIRYIPIKDSTRQFDTVFASYTNYSIKIKK